MPDGATPVSTADVLVAIVQSRISRLADGNPFPLERIQFEGSRTDRTVRLGMRVPLEAPKTKREHVGAIHPEGSTLCADAAAVDACLKGVYDDVAQRPATLKRVQEMVSANPSGSFAALDDGVRIGIPAGRCHVHCQCQACSARGKLFCRNCSQTGQVACGCLNGKLRCYDCNNGYVSYVEYRNNVGVTKTKACGSCYGSGRGLNCPTCWGSAFLKCNPCGGSGWVGCQPCATSGWLTVATSAELVVRPVRTLRNAGDLPEEFAVALKAMNFRELPVEHGTVQRQTSGPENGAAAVQLECLLADVRVDVELAQGGSLEATFPRRKWSIVAVGKTARIPTMPRFLDDLLFPLSASIEAAALARQAEKALKLARDSRLTASILKSLATGSGESDAALVVRWKQAVSETFVTRIREALETAYDGVGAGVIKRCWLSLGMPALAAAAFACQLGRLVLLAFPALPVTTGMSLGVLEVLVSAAVGILPVAGVGLLARWTATRAARRAVGADARRAPRQGWWLRVPVGLAVALLIAGFSRSAPFTEARPLLPTVTSHLAMLGGLTHSADPRKVITSSLSPSAFPALAAVWAPKGFRGDPQVYMTQFCLAQLGFLAQQPNGRMDTATRNAIERLVSYLPRNRRRPTSNAEAALLASAALRGEYRLEETPADAFVTAGMSNLARANLTGLDVEAIKASAFRALRDPGVEIPWTSRDGGRGGRVIATALPDGCSAIDVEVRVRGAVERTGPTSACWSHGSLLRMNSK